MQVEVESQAEGWGRGVYIPLAIVIGTELENVVGIRPGMPEMFASMSSLAGRIL